MSLHEVLDTKKRTINMIITEVHGNIWDFHEKGDFICITTNEIVKPNDRNVMGKGLALQAKKHFPDIDRIIGLKIKEHGNIPFLIEQYKIITFPTKTHYSRNSDMDLIIRSAIILNHIISINKIEKVYLPEVGCGNGNLSWNEVKKTLNRIFINGNNEIIIVHYEKNNLKRK